MAVRDIQQTVIPHVAKVFDTFIRIVGHENRVDNCSDGRARARALVRRRRQRSRLRDASNIVVIGHRRRHRGILLGARLSRAREGEKKRERRASGPCRLWTVYMHAACH